MAPHRSNRPTTGAEVAETVAAQRSEWLDRLGAGTAGRVDARELVAVAGADPGTLPDAITQLQVIDRLAAWVAARRHVVIAALCPADDTATNAVSYLAEQHLVEEIQLACRVGPWAATTAIEAARALATVFPATRAALAAGEVSDAHVRVLVAETARVGDDPPMDPTSPVQVVTRTREQKLAMIQGRVLGRARTQSAPQFRTSVQAAVCAVDAIAEAERRAVAKTTRGISVFRGQDGMGVLYDEDDQLRVTAIYTELTRRAKALQAQRGGARAARTDSDARLGACRADALAAAILGTHPDTASDNAAPGCDDAGSGDAVGGQGSLEPREPVLEGHLVIDLATLRREAAHPCTLDGVPIPAQVGRELAGTVKAWRRIVTDPVTGHLLDYGTRTYLPDPLVKFIKARDGQCTAPYCERPATRCQMDHRVPFPDGPSSATNCGALCDRHHPLKTSGYTWIQDGHANGAMTWVSQWGQAIPTEPRPYLDNPRPEQPHHDASGDIGPPAVQPRLRPTPWPAPPPIDDNDEPPF